MAVSNQTTSVGQHGGTFDDSLGLTDLLVKESGRISGDIYRKTLDTSPWLKLVKQTIWPDEMGDTLSVLTYERSLAQKTADDSLGQAWENVKSTDANLYAVPSATKVTPSTTQLNFSLAHTAIESAPIIVNDLRFSYNFREQLRAIYDNLVENVSWAWKDRYRDQYYALCKHNIIAGFTQAGDAGGTGALVEDTTAGQFSAGHSGNALVEANIGVVSNGVMNQTYMRMLRDGAGQNPMGRSNGRPVFTAILSAEASEKLITESDTRTDYRESDKVSELLKPLGVERSHRGFYHLIDPFPKRWDYNTSNLTWVEKTPYTTAGAINADYETADYEDVVIFHQDVMESLVPKPLSSAGSGTAFNAQSYRGKFNFLNISDRKDNPDGTWGYFRGILSNAAKPVKSQFAYIIRCKRPHETVKLFANSDGTSGSSGSITVDIDGSG